jgi:hypothetical protein
LNNDPSHGNFGLTVNPVPSVTVTITVFATTTTISTVPEYPVGLPIVAILMLIAYAIIRSRMRKPKISEKEFAPAQRTP